THHGGIVGRLKASQDLRAAGRLDPACTEDVLEGNGDAVEEAPGGLRGKARIGLCRLSERRLGGDGEVGLDLGIEGGDAVEVLACRLRRGGRSAAEARGQLVNGD